MSYILKKENRIVLIIAIICLIFIGVIINYTYSFFAVEKTNSSIIAGEAESMKLDLTVVEKSSTNNGKLIPQLDEYITSAVKGRNGSCIDDNNNTVCQVYKITLKNSGSSSVYVNGEVVLNKQSNPNLKWAILNNTDSDVLTAPVLNGDIKTPEETVLTSNELFTAGQTKNYFIVVWISETGLMQIDSGKFTGVVNFNNGENNNSIQYERIDNSGANAPSYIEGMIPVMYDESTSSWVKADTSSSISQYGWYDYDAKKWANGVLVTNANRNTYKNATPGTPVTESDILAYYVWIPRYKYKVWNINKEVGVDTYNAQTTGIDIVFIDENEEGTITCNYSYAAPSTVAGAPNETCTDITNGTGYYTHPAFKFGNDNVAGFWMGKFELSSTNQNASEYGGGISTTLTPRILPNVISWRRNPISNFYKVIKNMQSSGNEYGLLIDTTVVDSHMLTNMEWGAAAYLTHSKYGRCDGVSCTEVAKNNSGDQSYTTNYTGRSSGSGGSNGYLNNGSYTYNVANGKLASSTGNIYGVYDMSGGAAESVMGSMSSFAGSFTYYASFAGDNYTYSESTAKYLTTYANGSTENDQTSYNRGRLGDATSEVVTVTGESGGGWYNDHTSFLGLSQIWFIRGGGFSNNSNAGVFFFSRETGGDNPGNSARATLIGF